LRLPYYLGLLAQVCVRAGRAEDGLAAIDEGMAASRAHNERWWDAELHRLRGELLLAGGADRHEAETAYGRAIEIARTQQARALELRAVMSVARLYQKMGRQKEARDKSTTSSPRASTRWICAKRKPCSMSYRNLCSGCWFTLISVRIHG